MTNDVALLTRSLYMYLILLILCNYDYCIVNSNHLSFIIIIHVTFRCIMMYYCKSNIVIINSSNTCGKNIYLIIVILFNSACTSPLI